MENKQFQSKEQKEAQQVSEIDNLRYMQKRGMDPKVPANKDSSIEIPEIASKGYVFVVATMIHMNADQKSVSNIDSLIPIHADNFDRMVAQGGFALYDKVKIVHDPREGAKVDYDFKVRQVESSSTDIKGDGRAMKSADMSAINEARKGLEQQKVTLENKTQEITKKENDLTVKESTLTDREAELKRREDDLLAQLKQREDDLRARELALKTPTKQ